VPQAKCCGTSALTSFVLEPWGFPDMRNIFISLCKQQKLWHRNCGPARTVKGTEWHMQEAGSWGFLPVKGVAFHEL